jgi:hypothetical protein
MARSKENGGEGDRESARRFNKAEKEFVNSGKGKKAMQKTRRRGDKTADEDLKAERKARARAKEHDPAVTRDYRDGVHAVDDEIMRHEE